MHDPIGTAATVRVTAAPPLGRVVLRGDLVALYGAVGLACPAIGMVAAEGPLALLRLGPDESLALGPEPALASLLAWSGSGSAVDVGHRQTALLLEGPDAAELLNAGCPLDLHPAAFPPGRCTRTLLAKAEIVLWRTALDRFHLEVGRSYAAYAWALLEEAWPGMPSR